MSKTFPKNVGFYESRNGGTFSVTLDEYTLDCLEDLVKQAREDFKNNSAPGNDERQRAGQLNFTKIPEGRNTKLTHSLWYKTKEAVDKSRAEYQTRGDSGI